MCSHASSLGAAAQSNAKTVNLDVSLNENVSYALVVIDHETGVATISGESYVTAERIGDDEFTDEGWKTREQTITAGSPAGLALGDFFHALSVQGMIESVIGELTADEGDPLTV